MTFLGLEQPVAYGREQVFDPTTAQMVLNANRDYINAVYRDYQQAMADMKEFNKEYGDFTSPIQADMDWYYNNVTGRVKNFINDLYARGIDPIRSQEGRAAIARELATMPTKGIADVRQSAADATEYLKNMAALEADGDYDPDLEKFATKGMMLDNWDTNRYGIWTRKSPLKAKSLKSLTEASFNNRTALDLTKDDVESFGMKYDPNAQYTGFAKRHLKDIADKIAPGLYGTPYFDYYRDLAKRRLQSFGIDPTEANVNAQLAQDIADSQEEYLMGPKADYSNYYKRQEIGLRAAANQLARDKFNWEKQKYQQEHPESTGDGRGVNSGSGVSQWEQNYNDALANAASDGYTKYDPLTVSQYYGSIGKNINAVQDYFGSGLKKDPNRDEKFKYRYTKPVDVIGILQAHGGYKDGENSVSLNLSDIGRLWSEKDILTSTRGNSSRRTRTSKPIQNEVETALKNGTKDVRMYPHGTKYGAQTKDNTFDIYAPIDIVIVDADGNIEKRIENVYWDTRWGTRESLYRPDPGPTNLFKTEQPGPGIFTNTYPTMWGASSVLPSDTRGTKSDYNASPSVKLGTSYK